MNAERDAGRFPQVLSWLGLGVLVWLVALVIRPFFNPLGWAAVIAIAFYPVHARLERRWGASRAAAAGTAAVTLIVIVPLLVVMTAFVREAMDAAASLQRDFADGRFVWVERAWRAVIARVPGDQRADLAAIATDAARSAAMFLAAQMGALVRNTAGFLVDLVLALFATFFFLRDSSTIGTLARRLLPMDAAANDQLIARTHDLVSVSVTSAGLVAGVQGLLGGLLFAAVGIEAPVFWGVVTALFCLMPFGAWIIWLPAAIGLAVSGAIGRALVVAGLGFGVVSAVDNVLRPALLSGRSSMNGLVILVSLLGGMSAFGALGLVLGPLIIGVAMTLLTASTELGSPSNRPSPTRPDP